MLQLDHELVHKMQIALVTLKRKSVSPDYKNRCKYAKCNLIVDVETSEKKIDFMMIGIYQTRSDLVSR